MYREKLIKSCESCVVRWKNFEKLTGDELRLIDDSRFEATFKPGEIILKQGSPAANVVFLAMGMAKIYHEGPERKSFILEIALPSRMIIGPGVHVLVRNSFSVTALTPVRACFISLQSINQVIRQNAEFAAGVINDLSIKSFNLQNRLLSLAHKRMPARLAEALLFFANEVSHSDRFDMILSRQELGDMTSMAKESVVRIMRELEEAGLIRPNGSEIQILEMQKLQEISDAG